MDAGAFHQMLNSASAEFADSHCVSPSCERSRVALFFAMRARLGHERVALHHSHLLAFPKRKPPVSNISASSPATAAQSLTPARYVLRVDGFYVCEWGHGSWSEYPVQAVRRARRVFRARAGHVRVDPSPIKLTALAPQDIDTGVLAWMGQSLIAYWASRPQEAVSGL